MVIASSQGLQNGRAKLPGAEGEEGGDPQEIAQLGVK